MEEDPWSRLVLEILVWPIVDNSVLIFLNVVASSEAKFLEKATQCGFLEKNILDHLTSAEARERE